MQNVSYLGVDSKGLCVWLSPRGEKKHGRITEREKGSESQWAAVTGEERHWRGIDKRLSRSRPHGWQLNSRMNGQPRCSHNVQWDRGSISGQPKVKSFRGTGFKTFLKRFLKKKKKGKDVSILSLLRLIEIIGRNNRINNFQFLLIRVI